MSEQDMSLRSQPYIGADDPCITCYAEDCLYRRKAAMPEQTKSEYAVIFPAPYICDVGGHSICDNHWPYAMIAGWNPRKKEEVFV